MTAPKSAKRDLTGAKLAFVEWLLAPNKTPRTQTELAGVLGVDVATLSDWKHDDLVLDQLAKAETRRQAVWAHLFAELQWVALQRNDVSAKVAAIRELGKLMGKYPSEKVDVTVDRVAYVEPGSLRELSRALHPELRN